jgi:uncharacterized protein YegL
MNGIAPRYHMNAAQRTPCMLVLDASGSMSGAISPGNRRIDELNRGLALLKEELCSDETASMRVQLAIVCVGGPSDDAELMLDWTDALDFEPPTLRANGQTPLGHGMRLALHHVEQHKLTLRQNGISYTRPWIMVISDGEPTDAPAVWQGVVEECRQAESAKRCVIFPIGVEDARLESLQQLSSTRAAKLAGTRFRQYFQWLSASLSNVSRSRSGDSVALPPTDVWAVFS